MSILSRAAGFHPVGSADQARRTKHDGWARRGPGPWLAAGVATGVILVALWLVVAVPELVLSPLGFVSCLALAVITVTIGSHALAHRREVMAGWGSRGTSSSPDREEAARGSPHSSSAADWTRELAILEERGRLAREMHDGLAQILGYVNAKAFAIRRSLGNGDTATATTLLADLEEAARDMCADVREVIMALRSEELRAVNLAEALAGYAAKWQRMTGVTVDCRMSDAELLEGLPHVIGQQVVRIVHEALANVRKHAQASRVTLTMRAVGSRLHIEVQDDGVGFDALASGLADGPTFGLQTMAERATAAGGQLTVASAPGNGTRVTFSIAVDGVAALT